MTEQQLPLAANILASCNGKEAVGQSLARAGYFASEQLATTVFLALHLRRPLFLEGEPGVGKTELALALARMLSLPLLRLQCYDGMEVQQVLYDWNYGAQALAVRQGKDVDLFSSEFLLPRPIVATINACQTGPAVLLIDEFDRADAAFEAFLLEFLSDFAVTISELTSADRLANAGSATRKNVSTAVIKAKWPPIIVITSNRTRDIHDAIKRRSLYHWLEYPEIASEVAILHHKLPKLGRQLAAEIGAFMSEVRKLGLSKLPGISETIDWARALQLLQIVELTPNNWRAALTALVKNKEDQLQILQDETLLQRARVAARDA